MNVSICIATFGDEAWSELAWSRAYPSALGQTDDIVVVHGTSLAEARNRAGELAKGDFLVYLDADDELCPGYVAATQDAVADTRVWLPYNEGEASDYMDPTAIYAPAVSYDGKPAAIPNLGGWPRVSECCIGTAVPRSLFLEVGGFREQTDDGTALTIYEDYALFLRLWDEGARIVHVPDAVYCAHGGLRNWGADWKTVYDAIWSDHEARVSTHA